MQTTDTATIEDAAQVIVRDVQVTPHVLFVFKHPLAGEFPVYTNRAEHEGSHGIWEDKGVIEKLVHGAQSGLNTLSMHTYAGMTKFQYFHFRQVHPHWDEYLERCKAKQMIEFMNLLNTEGVKDLTTMRWFLEHRHPDYGKKADREVDEPLQPTVNIAIGANVDAGIVQTAIREIAREILGSRRKDSRGDSERIPAGVAGEPQD